MTQSKNRTFGFLLILLFSSFAAGTVFAQTDSSRNNVSCDCDSAIKLNIYKWGTYGFTKAPAGFGNIQEIKASAGTVKIAFEQEHNSAWYLLTFHNSGELIFDVIPEDKKDDYDFLVFPYKDSTSCSDILKEKLNPLRGNLSRNDTIINSITGLSVEMKSFFNGKGIGAQYSKSMEVKAGEKYLLVLDNVYKNGKGHKIIFLIVKAVVIKGQVQNEEGKPIVAEIVLSDNKGMEVIKTNSDGNGDYTIQTAIVENINYDLSFSTEKSFFSTHTINTKNLKDADTFANIKTVLSRLKIGEKYKIGNLNFHGDSPEFLARSLPALVSLYQLMKKNPKLIIQIEGHVNGAGFPPSYNMQPEFNAFKQRLSDDRADAVYKYLTGKGIDTSRMSKIGYSDHLMLFPDARNAYETEANRRVEIKVVSLH